MKSFKHTSSSQQRREQTIIQITDNSTRRKNSNNNQSMTLELSNSSRIRIHERESCVESKRAMMNRAYLYATTKQSDKESYNS